MQIVIDDEEIIDIVETEWGYEGIREDIARVIRDDGTPLVEVLDEIRAEIERKAHSGQWSDATMYGMLKAVAIIDKYKAESEEI